MAVRHANERANSPVQWASPAAPHGRRHDIKPSKARRDYSSGPSSFLLRGLSTIDVVLAIAMLVLLYGIVHLARGATVPINPTAAGAIDTSPVHLPYYAARSLLRMFVALVASYGFTLVYGYAAARSRRAEKILIPVLDVLQSVPVLGFLSIAVSGFIALFPGSYLGLECASIFAIFTAQAWNLAFSFYHSLKTMPSELDEVARLLRLPRWLRFWRIDVPSAAIGLIWNGMMSMGGAWFFLVASESISVLNKRYALPGLGSYAGAAIDAGNLNRVMLAIMAMAIVVVAVNFVFWRPLVAWSERFKNEQSEGADRARSVALQLLRRSHWPRVGGRLWRRLADPANRAGAWIFGTADCSPATDEHRSNRWLDIVFWLGAGGGLMYGTWQLALYVTAQEGWGVFWAPLWQGLVTLARVLVLVVGATVVWVPIGVKIGLNPRAARLAQPIVQLFACFPANFLFPLAVYLFVRTGVSLDLGGVLLMSLGAQWYILFNAIAAAQAIPTDLQEALTDLGVRGWQRWRRLILPAIFPAYVTGAITATGGAWNASIVAEIVTYNGTTLTATGLGAYIALATDAGNSRHLLAGVAVMALYVVILNRVVWRRLYQIAETRYAF